MDDRLVTGSCEQCGQGYPLLIPEPGSRDLEFQRVGELLGWCVGCGQFVGRTCCWTSGRVCTRCSASDAESSRGFAAISAARAAVRRLDGLAADFTAMHEAIGAVDTTVRGDARGSWQDAWLAAGALRTRIDDARDAVISRLRSLPPTEAGRVRELRGELDDVISSHEARWRLATAALSDAGERLAIRVTRHAPRRKPIDVPRNAEPKPSSVASTPVSVPLAVRAPGRVTILTVAQSPVSSAATSRLAMPQVASRPALRSRSAGATRDAATANPPPVPASTPTLSPGAATPPAVAPTTPVASPEAALRQAASDGREDRRRRATIAAFVVGVMVFAGGLLAGGPLLTILENRAGRGQDLPAVGDGNTGATSVSVPSPSPSLATAAGASLPVVLTFDLHPIGPLDLEEVAATRISGAPEVAAFPTSFDRSMRIGGVAGVCFVVPPASPNGSSAMAFDLHFGDADANGMLAIGLASTDAAPAIGVALDLAALDELDPDAWYRLTVTFDGQDARAEVAHRVDDRLVLETDLALDPTALPISGDEACLQSMPGGPDGALFIDNLEIER